MSKLKRMINTLVKRMKKASVIAVMCLLLLSLFGCSMSNTPNEQQQAVIDTVWSNKNMWQEINGYAHLKDKSCNQISFGKCDGSLVFTAYHIDESSSTISSNTYYVNSNGLVEMDYFKAKEYTMGLFTGRSWSSNSTKDDLQRIYLEYDNSK